MTTATPSLPVIRLALAGDALTLTNERVQKPLSAALLLRGKTLSLSLDILRMLLTLCPEAHAAALTAAVRAAGLKDAPDPGEIVRRALVEAVSETVRTAVYDIPRRHGALRPALDAVRGLRAAHAQALADNLSDASEAAFREAVRSALEEDLLCEVMALFNDFSRLPAADAKTLLTVETLADDEFASLGQELLDGRLEAPRAGVPGALARECVRQGLLPAFRPKDLFAARLSEVNRWLADEETRLGALRTVGLPSPEPGHGAALSALETARGALFAAVETDGSRIVRAGFLAPTEWSLRADGLPLVWAKHFLTARGDDPRLKERLETLFAAFDPCTDLVWEDGHA